MAHPLSPVTVALFQQGAANSPALVDVTPGVTSSPNIAGTALRCFTHNDVERAEFRMGILADGTWDLFMVNAGDTPGSVLISTGTGDLKIPSLPSAPGSTVDLVIDSGGKVFRQTSSLRYKENVKPLEEDFSKIMAIQPISFTTTGATAEQIGYAAEDVAAAGLEHLVTRDPEGRPDSVSYKHLGIYAIELLRKQMAVVQEQAGEILRLRQSISALEFKLAV